MVSKGSLVLKNQVSRLCKVCVPAKCSINTKTGEKHKGPKQENSVLCRFVWHLVLVCIINTKTMKTKIKKSNFIYLNKVLFFLHTVS